MRLLRQLFLSLLALFVVITNLQPTPILAESTEPFAPFSIEGNPSEDYHFNSIFPLFRFVRPRALKIFENRDRSRAYKDYALCSGGDRRDQDCSVDAATGREIDPCTGGDVDICYSDGSGLAYTDSSSTGGSCSARKSESGVTGEIVGKCSYQKKPSVKDEVGGTDFSNETPVYPKYQNEAYAYSYQGTSNAISWGSQYLTSDFCSTILRKVIVVRRAKQTKNTVATTGQWPLGWVDWGYQVGIDHDLNSNTPTVGLKTLQDISDGLPNPIAGKSWEMIEMLDDMYMNPGNYELLVGLGDTQKIICDEVKKISSLTTPPEWYINLMSAPLYPPSFRQGFIRPSICKWFSCCPGSKCALPEELLIGIRRGLYYDTAISQTFNAALDELFTTYPLRQAMRIFINLSANNPLIRFATVASEYAIPSRITEKLTAEQQNNCLPYIPWSGWNGFGTHIDYLNPNNYLGPDQTCPDYKLQPDVTKDKGGSYVGSPLSWLLSLIWGEKTDQVEPTKEHLITIPEAMGQSIKEIKQGFYDSRDTLANLEADREFNDSLSVTIDNKGEGLLGGKSLIPANTRRTFAYYTCADPMFSSQLDTSVEQYALGTRVGCDKVSNSPTNLATTCSPEKFATIIADSPWNNVPSNVTSIIQNSAMFEGGDLNPKLEEVYAKISEETGVPCEVLAGHHFEEATTCFTASGNPEACSVANGGSVKDQGGLEETARSAANGLLRHPINNTKQLITAISNFNGGGNSNCQQGFVGGTIPYGGCPRLFQGEDDPYAMNLVDGKHTNMFLLYCGDFSACIPPKPYGNDRPGVFPVALVVHEYLKARTPTTSPRPSALVSNSPQPSSSSNPISIFRPVTCGEGSLGTALGCLPYAYQPFVTTLLRFLIGISGGIALSVMLTGVARLMTSSGDPKQIQSGRDLFSAGVAGLLFVIFSVALLRLIAADILKLPGF